MYAIVKVGGKQYRVSPGDFLKVERMDGDVGQAVVLDKVLTVCKEGGDIVIGRPLVQGATVKATVKEQGKAAKVQIFKMRRRKHYQKHQGHRQQFTKLAIESIQP